ncbi:MAG: gliding motility-associated C-terminal domain-containing protein [Lewinellaceae bacterium]|nr:gliding motility-associated C-terminal domain-containing protein [Lewinellaceae bacterium]
MKPIITLFCAALIAIASQVSGQNMSTSFTATPSLPNYPLGTQLSVDLNVSNFINVSSILLPITYNATVLQFDSIDSPVLPEYGDTTLDFHLNPGVIKITWFPNPLNNPDGVTIPGNNTRILTLRFTVVGNGTTTVNLSTTVPFSPIEVINSTGDQIFSNNIFQNGGGSNNGATIIGGVPTYDGFKIIGTTVYAKQNHRVCVPVTVNDFDSIQLMQYAMHWDNTKLNYDCVRGTAAPIVPTFNPPAAAPGTLLLQWEDPNLISGKGVTKPNGTRIYEVCFNTIGDPGTQTDITFDGLGFNIPPDFNNSFAEAYNANGQSIWEESGPNGPSGVSSTVFILPDPVPTAAVTYTVVSDTIKPDSTKCIKVNVKNFSAITESEFLLSYDALSLSYTTPVSVPATPLNIQQSNFTHQVNGTTGLVKFKWKLPAGATVADNTTIFAPCFTAIGAPNTAYPITFGTSACPNPTPFATLNAISGEQYRMEDGEVLIKSASGPPMASASNALCPIGATGSLSCTPNGDATGYLWSYQNKTTQNVSNVPTGTYTVTVTYSTGTTATASATVSSPDTLKMDKLISGVNCFGESSGAINITPKGGVAPYSGFVWSGPNGYTALSEDIAGVATGNYSVSFMDANGCFFVSPVMTVTTPQAISITSPTVSNVTCSGGSNGAVNITPQGGTAPYTYDWSNDGPEDPDNDPQNITGLTAGTITCTITDSKGCVFSPPAMTITSPQPVSGVASQVKNVTCFGSSTGGATITPSGGNGGYSYSWRTVPGNTEVSTQQSPTNLPAGTYNVVITDNQGCSGSVSSNVTINGPLAALTISNTTTPGTCFGEPTGSIDLTVSGGWGGYTYAWPSGLPSIPDPVGVSSGTYVVTVTDNNGCSGTNTVVVSGPQSAISYGAPQVTNVSCFGQGNGSICITPSGGAGAPYSVIWSNGQNTNCINNLQPGPYSLTITDGQQCTNVFSAIDVAGPMPLVLNATTTEADPLGGIDLTVIGGTPNYAYAWAGANGSVGNTQDLNNMPPGTYTVTVTDDHNCTMVGSYTIVSANVLTDNVTVTSVQNSCNDDGCINIEIGASATSAAPFTISWSGGTLPASSDLNQSLCGLPVGIYVVTVTASNGNSTTLPAQLVNQLQPASATISFIPPTGALQNGSITISPTFPGSTSFLWNTGATTNSISSLDSGLYVVTVTNTSSGCTAVYPIQLDRQYPPYTFFNADVSAPACLSTENGHIVLNVSGGVPPLTYSWVGPNGYTATTKDIYDLASGMYSVTVTQGDGTQTPHGPFDLTAQSALSIFNVNEISITPGGTQVSGANVCDGVSMVVFGNGVGVTSIMWSNGVTTATNASMCGGDYSVTVSDALGCTAVWSDALTVPAPITAQTQATAPTCGEDTDGSAKVYPTGGIEPYDVVWSNGQSDQLVFSSGFSEAIGLAGGSYQVTIYDANDVAQVVTVNVPVPTPIEVTFTTVDPFNFNTCDGERIAFVTGAVDPVSYTWSGSYGHSGDNERAEGLCAGEVLYFEIEDGRGCSVSIIDSIPYPEDGCWHVRPVLTPAEQDGNNDWTLITCAEASANTVEIYNRWGQLVFQTENYSNNPSDPTHTWTGFTRSGQALPEGVYYCVITYQDDQGNQHQVKSHINLLK